MEDAKRTADLVLNDLVRMATAMRTGATSSRQQKADSSFDPHDDDYRDLHNHLQLIVATHASTLELQRANFWSMPAIDLQSEEEATEQQTTEWSQKSGKGALDMDKSPLTVVQERLVSANLRRHHRFVYFQIHGRKITRQSVAMSMLQVTWEEITQSVDSAPPTMIASEAATGYTQIVQLPREMQEPHATELTDTTATGIGSKVLVELAKQPTASQQAVTVMSTTGLRLRYPHPPKFSKKARVFKCPCCSVTLPVTFAEKRRWR